MASIFDKMKHDDLSEGLPDEFEAPTSPEIFREMLRTYPLEQFEAVELYSLRSHIDTLLPIASMKTLNLSEELVRQYQYVSALQVRIVVSNDDPAKKATVMNSVSSTLQHLVKMQAEFYTAERLKNIESLLIDALEELPKEVLTEFFDKYEKMGIDSGV